MVCSECGAPGVTRASCPSNPDCKNPKMRKHQHGGADTPKLKIKARLKPVKPQTVQKAQSLEQAKKEAKAMFPKDIKMQDEYVADYLNLLMPKVPKGYDGPSMLAKQRQEHAKERRALIEDKCARCLKGINARGSIKDATTWGKVSTLCNDCHREIEGFYHSDLPDNRAGYSKYHHDKAIPVDALASHGSKNGYYNATMYEGAKHWSGVAARRMSELLPKVP